MAYNFDVIFLDSGQAAPYHRKTLDSQPMGGVEASAIRVAEGLGAIGLKVAIVKCSDADAGINVPQFEPIYGQHCYYLHESMLDGINPSVVVLMRGPLGIDRYPKARKFIWLHDLASEWIVNWLPIINHYHAKLVCVSKWHMKNVKAYLPTSDISYIYNPIEASIYVNAPRERVNRNLLVWASSPHKGLDGALSVFAKAKVSMPELQLIVYNPGYMAGDIIINPGVLYYGPTHQRNMWHTLKSALCVFYPTEFQETFGLVMAEANAMGVPVLGYKSGALPEIVHERNPLAKINDTKQLLSTLSVWHNGGPPTVYGDNKFKTQSVIVEWFKLLAKS